MPTIILPVPVPKLLLTYAVVALLLEATGLPPLFRLLIMLGMTCWFLARRRRRIVELQNQQREGQIEMMAEALRRATAGAGTNGRA